MQWMAVVVKCQVDCSVFGANPDGYRIVSIVAFEMIILKANGPPLASRQFATRYADLPISVVVANILIFAMGYDSVLLKR